MRRVTLHDKRELSIRRPGIVGWFQVNVLGWLPTYSVVVAGEMLCEVPDRLRDPSIELIVGTRGRPVFRLTAGPGVRVLKSSIREAGEP